MTNVPYIRVQYRLETLEAELGLLARGTVQAAQAALGGHYSGSSTALAGQYGGALTAAAAAGGGSSYLLSQLKQSSSANASSAPPVGATVRHYSIGAGGTAASSAAHTPAVAAHDGQHQNQQLQGGGLVQRGFPTSPSAAATGRAVIRANVGGQPLPYGPSPHLTYATAPLQQQQQRHDGSQSARGFAPSQR